MPQVVWIYNQHTSCKDIKIIIVDISVFFKLNSVHDASVISLHFFLSVDSCLLSLHICYRFILLYLCWFIVQLSLPFTSSFFWNFINMTSLHFLL